MSAEIDRLVAEFFAAFDNRSGHAAAVEGLRDLFLPSAIIVKQAPGGPEQMTVDTFIAPRAALLASARLVDFHEWETHGRTDITGTVASRVSRYAKSGCLDGAPYDGTGVKHLSFALTAAGWRIASLVWEDD